MYITVLICLCRKIFLYIFSTVYVFSSSATKTILVQNCIVVHRTTGCIMPFSWIIKDRLEELWVHALHREGNGEPTHMQYVYITVQVYICSMYMHTTGLEIQSMF